MAETLEEESDGTNSDQKWAEDESNDLEDVKGLEDLGDDDDNDGDGDGDGDGGGDGGGDSGGGDQQALDELEAEELEMLTEDEEAESLPVDEAEELRQIRRAAMSLESAADSPGEDEFVCSSCFLVKAGSQLADKRKKLCRDCA